MATRTAKVTATAADSPARRFAVACGVLSQFVKGATNAAPVATTGPFKEHGPFPNGAGEQLAIFYGGKVVVLDGCTPARAAVLLRYAASAAQRRVQGQVAPEPALVDIPLARKASLQRFLAKRKCMAVSATVPAELPPPPPPAKKGKTEASSWLTLGSLGGMHVQ